MTADSNKKKKAAVTMYTEAVGRRKTATARVRLLPAQNSAYKVNDRSLEAYFTVESLRKKVQAVFESLPLSQKFEVYAMIKGGGVQAQAEALRHAISRALVIVDKDLRRPLKTLGFLTRDARAKERRKFGLKKARKAPQWSKR